MDRAVAAEGGLAVGEFFEVIDVGELFFSRLCGEPLVVLADKRQLEVFEVLIETAVILTHR